MRQRTVAYQLRQRAEVGVALAGRSPPRQSQCGRRGAPPSQRRAVLEATLGSGGVLPWTDAPGRGRKRADFPPLAQALVKAVACEAVQQSGLPLSRLSTTDSAAQASKALGKAISPSTVWRILAADAIKPWRYKYWIFPRDPHFAEKAGRVLDLYAGYWQGIPLGPKEYIISADEKTSIQARPAAIRACPRARTRDAG